MNAKFFTALNMAVRAHHGQLRKETDQPYILHPLGVAELVAQVTDDEDMLVAAVLHDVLEDSDVYDLHDIRFTFGERVANLVDELTDKTVPEDGNRATRRAMDHARLALISADAQTIKLADIIHNTQDITKLGDTTFVHLFMQEKHALIPMLTKGNQSLIDQAWGIVWRYFSAREGGGVRAAV